MIRDPSDGSVKAPAPAEPGIDTAKHGPNYGLKTLPEKPKSTFKAPSAEELAKHYAKYKLAYEPKEADPIPD
jgi:hypothetical protein